MDVPSARPVEILLVENNPGDARLILEGLKDAKVLNTLHHVWDGEEAIAFLRREGEWQASPRPDLVLLDLDLPRMDGREVLAEIKGDPGLRNIPVVVLTSSKAEEEILQSDDLHADSYAAKPIDVEEFLRVIGMIEDFWLTVVCLPTRP